MNNSYPQARAADIVISELPDEVLVYDLKTHQAHCLNKTAALIWRHCDGKRTVADITRAVEVEELTLLDETTVWAALDQLEKSGLLAASVTRPADVPSFSRRRAMRKLGLGAVAALPFVVSVIAPTAAEAATCQLPALSNNGGACTAATVGRCCLDVTRTCTQVSPGTFNCV